MRLLLNKRFEENSIYQSESFHGNKLDIMMFTEDTLRVLSRHP